MTLQVLQTVVITPLYNSRQVHVTLSFILLILFLVTLETDSMLLDCQLLVLWAQMVGDTRLYTWERLVASRFTVYHVNSLLRILSVAKMFNGSFLLYSLRSRLEDFHKFLPSQEVQRGRDFRGHHVPCQWYPRW